jgi:PAS domain S-box-containing protein
VDEQIDLFYARGVIRECNRQFAEGHGFRNPEDMIGFRFGQVLPRLAPQNVENLRRFIASGYQLAGMESKELALEGSVRYFLNSLSGHVEDGGLIRIWSTKQDITRIKAAEEEVRVLNAELEQRVKQRTAQLEEANRELESFAYTVSHDLRAPLRAIDGYTRILQEDYAPLLDDEGKRFCSAISGGPGPWDNSSRTCCPSPGWAGWSCNP